MAIAPRGRLHRAVRCGVLITAAAGAVVLLIVALGSAGSSGTGRGVDVVLPAITGTGVLGGLLSSIRYLGVRLALGEDATSIGAGRNTWGQLRGMVGDLGWAALLGAGGSILILIVRLASHGGAGWGDALAFLLMGALWPAGYLAAVVAAFLIWMPTGVFTTAATARRRGATIARGWLVLAWCLVVVDVMILLMVANAVFVPTGDGHAPWAPWQTALFVVSNGLLVLISFALSALLIVINLPTRSRRRRREALAKRSGRS